MASLTLTPARMIVLPVVVVLLAGACGASDEEPDVADAVTVRYSFDWSPDSDWAPVLWADELGYFDEEGIDVDYVAGDPQLIELLGANEIDIAQVPGPQAVLAFAEGLPITVVGVQLPESPLVLLADADAGVVEPGDIEGHSVAVQVGEFEGFVWEAWAAANGIDRSNVDEVPAGGAADVLFIDHQVDVFMDFYTSGAMVELTDGREGEESLFLVSDTLDMVGQSQVVHQAFLDEHPGAVAGFLDAWARGAKYALEHPDETIDLVLETFPELDRPGVEWSFARFSEFWTGEQFTTDGFLSFTPEMWESTEEVLLNADLIDDIAVDELYTDEFLPDPPVLP
ncbi:MAG: ABC transporter substrate-binding protein [Acidimicrobiales bacterium]